MPSPPIAMEKRWQIARALKAGKTHAAIARALSVGITTVTRYAKKFTHAGLIESKHEALVRQGCIMEAKIRRLLLAGKSGRWIVRNVPGAGNIDNVKRRMAAEGIRALRERPQRLSRDQEREIKGHLARGWSINRIHHVTGCGWRSIRKRAVKLGFRIGKRGPVAPGPPIDPLLAIVEAALPKACEPWIREEARNELWIELATKVTPPNELAARARKLISEIYGRYDCFDRWKKVSLDAPRSEGDRRSLVDLLACPLSDLELGE
jgi:hypothetical protein